MSETDPATPQMCHFIQWSFDQDQVIGEIICDSDPGANCRLAGDEDCKCESWTIQRDADGTAYHYAPATQPFEPALRMNRHIMHAVPECNFKTWIEESDNIMEMHAGLYRFPIGKTVVEPQWEGDFYEWKLPEGEKHE